MFFRIILCSIIIIFIIESKTPANPFASKLDSISDQEGENSLEMLVYKGYIFYGLEKYAIIQLGNKQYTLKKGQKIDKLEIIEISLKNLHFKSGEVLLKTSLEKNKNDLE